MMSLRTLRLGRACISLTADLELPVPQAHCWSSKEQPKLEAFRACRLVHWSIGAIGGKFAWWHHWCWRLVPCPSGDSLQKAAAARSRAISVRILNSPVQGVRAVAGVL
jgi:hypothetical protein